VAGRLAETLTHLDLQVLSAACNLDRSFVSKIMDSLIALAVQKGVHKLHSSFLLTAQGDRLPQGIGRFPEPFHISLRCSLNRM
jgi:predicted transcriptional regulator